MIAKHNEMKRKTSSSRGEETKMNKRQDMHAPKTKTGL